MKKSKRYYVLATAVAGILWAGCVKEAGIEAGSTISFSASSATLETRTVYGATNNVASPPMQYIDWVNGDKMTILKVHEEDIQYADYAVKSDGITPSASTAKSEAQVEYVNQSGTGALTWGSTGSHTFYAIFPEGDYDSENSKLTAEIPATQDANQYMPAGFMYATPTTVNVTQKYDVQSVNLRFNAAFSAFAFHITNSTGSPITLTSFQLTSATKALNGDISCSLAATPVISHTTTSNDPDERTISASSSITIANGSSVDFVFTTLPNEYPTNDLSISCSTANNVTRTLTLTHRFAANYKHRIEIALPSFEATYSLSVTNPTLAYTGQSQTPEATATVTSMKTVGSSSTAEAWFVEGYYATEEDANNGTNKLTDYSTTGLLRAAIDNGSGSTSGESVTIKYNYATAQTLGSFIDDNIKNSTFGAKSSSTRYINLANASNLTSNSESDIVVESANCYIVNGPGYYRIPLIMGNGQSFSSFVNYKGNTVASGAYLKNQGGVPTTAKVVWEDVDGLINGASSSNSWVIPNAISGDWLKFYIDKEHIKQGNAIIAVYDNAATPAIMWSYHIWVTDYVPSNYAHFLGVSSDDITHTNSRSVTYTLPPYDLGMVVDGSSTNTNFYSGSIIYARLQQGTPSSPVGQHAVMRIQRPEHSGTITSADLATGHCTYFQWGRKDPVQGDYTTNGLVNSINNDISASGTVAQQLVQTITNPGKTISSLMGSNITNNLWDGSITSTSQIYNGKDSSLDAYRDRQGTKTMYDPSPAGYYVPPYKAIYPGDSFALPAIGYRNGGSMASTSSTYHWYSIQTYGGYAAAYRNDSSNNYIWKDAQRPAAMPIRPVRDPSFDPTSDGIIRGTGPNIIWQN